MPRTVKRKYGCTRDAHDSRDRLFQLPRRLKSVPAKVDLRDIDPPVYDQGSLGSCTFHSVGAAFEQARLRDGRPSTKPSMLFPYYNVRAWYGLMSINSDTGASIRDGIKAAVQYGLCDESYWPYVVSRYRVKPPKDAYLHAEKNQAIEYLRVPQSIEAIKQLIAQRYMISFGFDVYPSFESQQVARTGVVPFPSRFEQLRGSLGGHAVAIVGYDDSRARCTVRNSWGTRWGDAGYCYMSYAFITSKICRDFWTIRETE